MKNICPFRTIFFDKGFDKAFTLSYPVSYFHFLYGG